MSERHTVYVTAFSKEQYGSDWPPEDPVGFMAWWRKKFDAIPQEYHASVKIEICGVGGYEGDSSGKIEITYRRPETDSEIFERARKQQAMIDAQKRQELATLAALKAKYGDAS